MSSIMLWILKAVYLGDPAQFYPNSASLLLAIAHPLSFNKLYNYATNDISHYRCKSNFKMLIYFSLHMLWTY